MECNVSLLHSPSKCYWRMFAFIPPSFAQIPFITWAFERAYFRPRLADEGLKADVLEGCGARWGATAGSRCLSGLLALHQDYNRQEARGQDGRLRPDDLFVPHRENIIREEKSREEVGCLSLTPTCWTQRFSHCSLVYWKQSVQCRLSHVGDILISTRQQQRPSHRQVVRKAPVGV